jgi:hypothetical protein
MRNGIVGEAVAANLAIEMMRGSLDTPRRYRLGAITEYDIMVLGVATGASAITATGRPEGSQRSAGQCVHVVLPGVDEHECSYASAHTQITYTLERVAGASPDPDVVPDFVIRWALVADAAWSYYHDIVGMTPTSDQIPVVLGMQGAGNVCGSWPTGQVLCGPGVGSESVDYMAAHEMFHQFQWHYVNRAASSLFELNPWMESTANWASAHFSSTMPRPADSWDGEAARIDAFFSSTEEGLVSRGEVTGGTVSGDRAYGAVAVVEYLAQQMQEDPSVESPFVKESFEAITPQTTDGLAPIDDALALHYRSLADVSSELWWAMYTMCDGSEPWSPFGWCSASDFAVPASGPGVSQTMRPRHDTVWLGSQPSGTINSIALRQYGAAFVDFVVAPVPENADGTSLVLGFDTDQVTAATGVTVVAWQDTPGGEQCNTRQLDYPAAAAGKTTIAIQIPADCDYATLVAINQLTGSGTEAVAFPVSWSTFVTGATIGNGTVTLGVNADGNLGLGVSQASACRKATDTARGSSSAQEQGPAFVLNATTLDAIRGADPCGETPTQGWSVRDPNHEVDGRPSSWSRHGLDYLNEYSVPVISFTFTSAEATSVVAVGTRYLLTQRWHPSTVDPAVYQLDVTLRSAQVLPPWPSEPVIYRHLAPLNVHSWHEDDYVDLDQRHGDGVTAATKYMYWPWDPDNDHGSIDDPLIALPSDGDYADGFAVDLAIDHSTVTTSSSPQFSLFYGFADSQLEAVGLLDDLHAGTRATAGVSDYNSATLPATVLIGLRRNAP